MTDQVQPADRTFDRMVGVVREVGFGNRDVGRPVLFFTVHMADGWSTLQVFSGDELQAIVTDSGVYDIKSMDGMTCWMRRIGPGKVCFDGWWNP